MNITDVKKIVNSQFGWVSNKTDKEDLIEEGILAFIEAKKDFDESFKTKFSTYAYHCITGKCKNYLKRKYDHYQHEVSINNFYDLESEVSNINLEVLDLKKKLKSLPESYQKIFELRLNGYTFKEIGEECGFSQSEIYRRYIKSLKILKDLLND